MISVIYWMFYHLKDSWSEENTIREHYAQWRTQWRQEMIRSQRYLRHEESYSQLFSVHIWYFVTCPQTATCKETFLRKSHERLSWKMGAQMHLALMRGNRLVTSRPPQILCPVTEKTMINTVTFLPVTSATCLQDYTTNTMKGENNGGARSHSILAALAKTARLCPRTGRACVGYTCPTTAWRHRQKALFFKSEHLFAPHILFLPKTIQSFQEILSNLHAPPHLWNTALYRWPYWSENKLFKISSVQILKINYRKCNGFVRNIHTLIKLDYPKTSQWITLSLVQSSRYIQETQTTSCFSKLFNLWEPYTFL